LLRLKIAMSSDSFYIVVATLLQNPGNESSKIETSRRLTLHDFFSSRAPQIGQPDGYLGRRD
jgi:hypothetical protein